MKILEILFPVFILVLLGYLYGRKYKPDMEASGKLVLQIFVPALVFDSLSSHDFSIITFKWLLVGGACQWQAGSCWQQVLVGSRQLLAAGSCWWQAVVGSRHLLVVSTYWQWALVGGGHCM